MMQRYLLPSALLLVMSAQLAHAAPSELCEQIQGEPVVSDHYTQRILARADDGLAFARESAVDNAFTSVLPGWIRTVQTAWANLIDSSMQRTGAERELPHVTACLYVDLLRIDCKIDEVREELHAQFTRGSSISIRQLLELLNFLNERRRNLEIGALDPLYTDAGWNTEYGFDRVKLPDETMCPFNADYTPPFQSGFGCDIETMTPLENYPTVRDEKEALEIITDQIEQYQENAIALLEVQKEIDELFGNPTTTPEPPEEREHLNAYGCGWTAGYCKNDPEKRCTKNDDCESGDTCDLPKQVCEGNRVIRCIDDSQCGNDGPCGEEDEAALPPLRELRGPFSLGKDEIAILSDFIGVRSAQELSRAFRDNLKLPDEFPDDEDDEREEREFEEKNPLESVRRAADRLSVQLWGRHQATKESLIFPEAVDAPLEVAASLTQLHTAVSSLAKSASEKTGLRQFVARYGYFLSRTCIYRPCQLLLEQVIRIVTEDECFPYANGKYLDDDEDNPRWEKCKDAAGI